VHHCPELGGPGNSAGVIRRGRIGAPGPTLPRRSQPQLQRPQAGGTWRRRPRSIAPNPAGIVASHRSSQPQAPETPAQRSGPLCGPIGTMPTATMPALDVARARRLARQRPRDPAVFNAVTSVTNAALTPEMEADPAPKPAPRRRCQFVMRSSSPREFLDATWR